MKTQSSAGTRNAHVGRASGWMQAAVLLISVLSLMASGKALAFGWDPGPPNRTTDTASNPTDQALDVGWDPGPPNRNMAPSSVTPEQTSSTSAIWTWWLQTLRDLT